MGPGLCRQQDTSDAGSHPHAQPGDLPRTGAHVLPSVLITREGSTPNTTARQEQLPATRLPDTSLTHHIHNTMPQASQAARRQMPCWGPIVSNQPHINMRSWGHLVHPVTWATFCVVTVAGSEGERQSHTPIEGGICFSDSGPSGRKVK